MHAQAATPSAAAPAQLPGNRCEGADGPSAAGGDDPPGEPVTATLRINPGRAEVLGKLALIHLSAGQHVQCIEAARGALAADSSHDESAYALAMALAATGATDEARVLHESLAHGDRAERFAQQRPQLAARSRDEARRLATQEPKAGASCANAASAMPPTRNVQGGALSRFIWEDFDPYTGLPARASVGGLKGWYSDHPVFESLIKERRPRRIAEVGSLFGASAVHMAKLLDQHGVDAEIVCVDTFLGSRETYFEHRKSRQAMLRRGQYHFFDQFLGNVAAAGQSHRITPFVQTSTNAARILREHGAQFDLVYLDASHEYIDVMSDLREWWPLVAEGGVLLGDDFEEPWFGIIRAGMEFADEIGRPIALHKAFASSPVGGRQNTKFSFVR